MNTAKPCQQHSWFDVGWGYQCGVCGLARLKSETSAALRGALIDSGVLAYELDSDSSKARTTEEKA